MTSPPHVYADPAVAFYPANSELLHAVGIVLLHHDVLSPFINLGWLALALLAAWCLGARTRVAPLCVVVVAFVLDLPVFSNSQPGSGDNDTMALALMLAALALLFEAETEADLRSATSRRERWSGPAVGFAGLAAGLALGTKLAVLAPVGLLSVAVLAVTLGRRARGAWIVGLAVGSGLWFVRNLVAFGNPIPAVRVGIGPLALPAARLPPSLAVADLLGDRGALGRILVPGLHWAFTFLWPALLGLALLGIAAAAVRGRARLERPLAAVAGLAATAYVFTPRTADSFGAFFQFNLRYLIPAVLIGLVLLLRTLAPRRPGLHAGACLLSTAALVADLRLGPAFHRVAFEAGATAVAIGLMGMGGVRASARARAAAALTVGVVSAALLWPVERSYLRGRYAGHGLASCELLSCAPLQFANGLHEARIAVAGGLGPYPLYGADLSNRVVDIEQRAEHGTATPIASCRAWREALASGQFQFVVTSAAYYQYAHATSERAAAWTRSDLGARVLSVTPSLFGGSISVFRLTRPPDPQACSGAAG